MRLPSTTTCAGVGGGSIIDFFVLDARIQHAFGDTVEVLDTAAAPHSPIRLVMQSRMRAKGGWRLAKPRPFPMERPCGPVPQPAQWPNFDHQDDLNGTQLDQLWKHISHCAETELVNLLGVEEPQSYLGRGDPPRWTWAPPRWSSIARTPQGNA